MTFVIIVFTSNLIFLLRHKYTDNSHSVHAESQSQSASALGAMRFQKASVQSFSKLILFNICGSEHHAL